MDSASEATGNAARADSSCGSCHFHQFVDTEPLVDILTGLFTLIDGVGHYRNVDAQGHQFC